MNYDLSLVEKEAMKVRYVPKAATQVASTSVSFGENRPSAGK
jgi:hypothetical protein